jgi:hypothetical protein
MIPHFAIPFRFKNVSGQQVAAVNDQDSQDEIFDAVQLVAHYPRGFRLDLPTFGITDQTFVSPAVDLERIKSEITEWEPRASTKLASERLDALAERITVDVFSR